MLEAAHVCEEVADTLVAREELTVLVTADIMVVSFIGMELM